MYSINFGDFGAGGALVTSGSQPAPTTPGPSVLIGGTPGGGTSGGSTAQPIVGGTPSGSTSHPIVGGTLPGSQFTAAGPKAITARLQTVMPPAVTQQLFLPPGGLTQTPPTGSQFTMAGPQSQQTPAPTFVAPTPTPALIQTWMQDLPRSDRPNEQPVPDAPVPDPTVPGPSDMVPAADAAAASKGFPIWAWALIGVGGLGLIGGIVYAVIRSKKSASATAGMRGFGMTLREAQRRFNEEILPAVVQQYGKKDKVAIRTAWNDWTDALQKDGQITEKQAYRWVPTAWWSGR